MTILNTVKGKKQNVETFETWELKYIELLRNLILTVIYNDSKQNM